MAHEPAVYLGESYGEVAYGGIPDNRRVHLGCRNGLTLTGGDAL